MAEEQIIKIILGRAAKFQLRDTHFLRDAVSICISLPSTLNEINDIWRAASGSKQMNNEFIYDIVFRHFLYILFQKSTTSYEIPPL